MSDLTSKELRQIEASHFMAIAQALISQADHLQCEAVKNLVFWRQRELRAEKVRLYKPGEVIIYLLEDSKTEAEGTIHHLNKLSVSIHKGAGQFEAIPVERIIRSETKRREAFIESSGGAAGGTWESDQEYEEELRNFQGGTSEDLVETFGDDDELPEEGAIYA